MNRVDHAAVLGKGRALYAMEFELTKYCTELKRKRAFRKFSYRGVDLDQYVPPVRRRTIAVETLSRQSAIY